MSKRSAIQFPVEAFMIGMRTALLLLTAICAVGIVTSLIRGKIRNQTAKT